MPIVKAEDTADLDRDSMVFQTQHGMDKQHADIAAYDKYKKNQHAQAAGHHLSGLDRNKFCGTQNDVSKHLAMYLLHAKELGSGAYDPVKPEIATYKKSLDTWGFTPHPADILIKK